MNAEDLIWVIAFVAWLLSGLLGRLARKRLQSEAEGKPPTAAAQPPAPAPLRRRLIEQLAGLDEDEEPLEPPVWRPVPPPAPRPAPLQSTPKTAPQPTPPLPPSPRAPTVADPRRAHFAGLRRAMVLAEVLGRPVSLR